MAVRPSDLPYWPARLGADMAAAFLGVSPTRFREKVVAGEYPKPVREGGRVLWSRRQLERFVDAQFGLVQAPDTEYGDDSWADLK